MILTSSKTIFGKPMLIQAILIVVIAVTIGFIFSNSFADQKTSAAQSNKVTEIIEPVLEPIVGKDKVSNHLVRKLAHITEFMLLGFELTILFRGSAFRNRYINPMFVSVIVALCDETIQIFSDRGSLVTDVWIDIGGAAIGMLIGTIGIFIVKAIATRKIKASN